MAVGKYARWLEPDGLLLLTAWARAKQTRFAVGSVEAGGAVLPVMHTTYGEVEGLPEPEAGTIYVVSALTAQAVPERVDVYITDDAVRDDAGRVIGCRGLAHV